MTNNLEIKRIREETLKSKDFLKSRIALVAKFDENIWNEESVIRTLGKGELILTMCDYLEGKIIPEALPNVDKEAEIDKILNGLDSSEVKKLLEFLNKTSL